MNVRDTLRAGGAVVVPNPAPLTHVVTARDPRAVNLAKGRPADQSVALWCHADETLDRVGECLDLDARALATGRRLLREDLVTLLVPLRAEIPGWLRPSVRDGWALLFGARWEPVEPLLRDHPVLYVSSANRTGEAPVATAAEARAMFGPDVPVLDDPGPDVPGPDVPSSDVPSSDASGFGAGPRSATTTLRLHPDGSLDLYRPGAQDSRRLLSRESCA